MPALPEVCISSDTGYKQPLGRMENTGGFSGGGPVLRFMHTEKVDVRTALHRPRKLILTEWASGVSTSVGTLQSEGIVRAVSTRCPGKVAVPPLLGLLT